MPAPTYAEACEFYDKNARLCVHPIRQASGTSASGARMPVPCVLTQGRMDDCPLAGDDGKRGMSSIAQAGEEDAGPRG